MGRKLGRKLVLRPTLSLFVSFVGFVSFVSFVNLSCLDFARLAWPQLATNIQASR